MNILNLRFCGFKESHIFNILMKKDIKPYFPPQACVSDCYYLELALAASGRVSVEDVEEDEWNVF